MLFLILILLGCTQPEIKHIEQNIDEKSTVKTEPIIETYENTCPLGLENDTYPGQCFRYEDHDSNGVCDFGE